MKQTLQPGPYPTTRLLLVIALSGAGLVVLWTVIRSGWGLEQEVYRGGLIGLAAAVIAHLAGTLAGAFLAPTQGVLPAYLASTVVRFIATPALAISLYFLLPVKPQPLLVGALMGYLLILVADIATLMRATQQPLRSGDGSTSA